MNAAIVLCAWCIVPHEVCILDRCDLIEVNHYHDEHGKAVFVQLIFWDFDPTRSDYHVVAWRFLKSQAKPRRDHARSCWVISWCDAKKLRTVRADCCIETWTQHDPEVADRQLVPERQRRDLLQSRPQLRPK